MAVEANTAAAGAEGATTFPPFDPTLFASQLIWFAITFIALYFIMSRVALPRVAKVVDQRAATVKGDINSAATNSAQAETERASAEKALEAARAKGRATVEAMRASVQAELGAEQEKAEAVIAKKVADAEAKIAETRRQGLAQVEGMAAELAQSIVAKIAPEAASAARKTA